MKTVKNTTSQFYEMVKRIKEQQHIYGLMNSMLEVPGLLNDYFTEKPDEEACRHFTFIADVSKALLWMCAGDPETGLQEAAARFEDLYQDFGSKGIDASFNVISASIFHLFSSVQVHSSEIERLTQVIICLNELNIISTGIGAKETIKATA